MAKMKKKELTPISEKSSGDQDRCGQTLQW